MNDLELIAELESLMSELENLEDPLLATFEEGQEIVVEELTPEVLLAHDEYEEKRDELIEMIEEIADMLSNTEEESEQTEE